MTGTAKDWSGPWRCRTCGHVFQHIHSHCIYCEARGLVFTGMEQLDPDRYDPGRC